MVESLESHQAMRAAGQIEALMGCATHTRFDGSGKARRPGVTAGLSNHQRSLELPQLIPND